MRPSAREGFAAAFGAEPEIEVWSPGRVNLIGEHTDYNDGFVMPLALGVGTSVAASGRSDGVLRTWAARFGELAVQDVSALKRGHSWQAYVAGCAAVLAEHGYPVPGADLAIDGNLPLGSGLSSSASLEIGVLLALSRLAGVVLTPLELARMGQQVENEFIGVRCGIMDQFVIAAAHEGSALLIDCRTLEARDVPLPQQVRVLVLDSSVPRTLASSAYNERRAQCESAVELLRQRGLEVSSLRDVTMAMLPDLAAVLPDVEHRRARHIVTENDRVSRAGDAIAAGDVATLGRLLTESHVSLRDDYEVSGPELDLLVQAALDTPGVLGARLTGAGFGGCAVALVDADEAAGAATAVLERYRRDTALEGTALVTAAHAGASLSTAQVER